jgi:hypothetical protein
MASGAWRTWSGWPRWHELLVLGVAGLWSWFVQSSSPETPTILALPLVLFVLVALPACLALLLAAWVMRWHNRPRPWQRSVERFLIVTLLVAGMLVATVAAIRRPIVESKARGARIVALLQAYRQRSGAYPQSLNLVPEAALLRPALVDWHFEYAPQDNGGFYLGIEPDHDSLNHCEWHGACDWSRDGWCCRLGD